MASLLQKVLLTLNLMDAEHYCRGLYGFKRSQSRSRARLRDVPDSTRPPPHAFSSVPLALQINLQSQRDRREGVRWWPRGIRHITQACPAPRLRSLEPAKAAAVMFSVHKI